MIIMHDLVLQQFQQVKKTPKYIEWSPSGKCNTVDPFKSLASQMFFWIKEHSLEEFSSAFTSHRNLDHRSKITNRQKEYWVESRRAVCWIYSFSGKAFEPSMLLIAITSCRGTNDFAESAQKFAQVMDNFTDTLKFCRNRPCAGTSFMFQLSYEYFKKSLFQKCWNLNVYFSTLAIWCHETAIFFLMVIIPSESESLLTHV